MKQTSGDDDQRIFACAREHLRRNHGVEYTPQNAADADEKVELGETVGIRSQIRQVAVAEHGDNEQRKQMDQNNERHRLCGAAENERRGGKHGDGKRAPNERRRISAHAREQGNARHEVENQRNYPEHRRRGGVGGDDRGDAKREAQGHERQRGPPKALPPTRAVSG